jgi:VanZ family protein
MNWIRTSLAIVVLGIAYLSLKAPAGGIEIKVNDKIGHLLAYVVLTINTGLLFPKNKWVFVAFSAFAFSALLEYLQGFVPGRSVDWKDLIANASGVLIGVTILLLFKEKMLNLLRKMNLVSK